MSADSPDPPGPLPLRRLAVPALIGLVAAAAAVSTAVLSNDPVGSGPRAPVRIGSGVTAPVAPAPSPRQLTLPPLALVLERPLPAALERLPAAQQLLRLRRSAAGGSVETRLQLAAAEQRAQNTANAMEQYRAVLATQPGNAAARTGALLASTIGGRGLLNRSGPKMAAIARAYPRNQTVSFNEGWLALYRGDRPTVVRAWKKTIEIDRTTRLGRSAAGALGKLAPQPVP